MGLVIFVYSLLFTSLVSFFAVMIIPDNVRPDYFADLIGGIAVYSVGGPDQPGRSYSTALLCWWVAWIWGKRRTLPVVALELAS